MRARLAFIAAPARLAAADHLRRLESSPLYRRREIEGDQAKQLSRARAFLYLEPDYYERYPVRRGR
jgi:hypothetical protein